MSTYLVCRMNGTHRRGARVPKIVDYLGDWAVKAGVQQWALVTVPGHIPIPPAAQADPDIFVLSVSVLDQVLTTPQRNAINTRLAQTDLGVTVAAGGTLRLLFAAIGAALGHTAAFRVD